MSRVERIRAWRELLPELALRDAVRLDALDVELGGRVRAAVRLARAEVRAESYRQAVLDLTAALQAAGAEVELVEEGGAEGRERLS